MVPLVGRTEWWQYLCTKCQGKHVYPYIQIEPPQTRTCMICDEEGCMIREGYMGRNPQDTATWGLQMPPHTQRATMDGERKPPCDGPCFRKQLRPVPPASCDSCGGKSCGDVCIHAAELARSSLTDQTRWRTACGCVLVSTSAQVKCFA
jgi:hypothetical protein